MLEKCMLKSKEMSQNRSQMGANIEKTSIESEVDKKHLNIIPKKHPRRIPPGVPKALYDF